LHLTKNTHSPPAAERRATGHSTYLAERIVEAQWVAAEHGQHRATPATPHHQWQ
jgi:hypothetical protein